LLSFVAFFSLFLLIEQVSCFFSPSSQFVSFRKGIKQQQLQLQDENTEEEEIDEVTFREGIKQLQDRNKKMSEEFKEVYSEILLLEKEKASKSPNKDDAAEDDTIKTFSFSFKAKHTHKLQLPGVDLADAYLSLPASEYSILSSSIISRSPVSSEKNNTFILSIPLGDYRVIDATLQAEVVVDPQPSVCRVFMESSNIVFLPTQVMKKKRPVTTDLLGIGYPLENSYSNSSSSKSSSASDSDSDSIENNNGNIEEDTITSNYLGDSLTSIWQNIETNQSTTAAAVDDGDTNSLPSWLIWGGQTPVTGSSTNGTLYNNTTSPGMYVIAPLVD